MDEQTLVAITEKCKRKAAGSAIAAEEVATELSNVIAIIFKDAQNKIKELEKEIAELKKEKK